MLAGLSNGITTKQKTRLRADVVQRRCCVYGVMLPGRGIEGETLVVNSLPFIDYMDGFPDEKNGLWGVVQELLGRKVDIPDLREKYKNVERVIVREEAE